ncbi:hypothetical protein ACMA5I_05230 [Paracoccaceae bacterium GXU_MW_L88]
MGRVLKYLFYLVILGLIGLALYAVFAELPAPQTEISVPVEPEAGNGGS